MAISGQFPVLWAGLSGEQIWGLGLPEEWVLGLDLSLGSPLTPLSSSPIAVNISTKRKRKKKKDKKKSKKRKISSLEATGHLQPRPARTFSGTEQRPALAARTSCIVHPSQGGQPPEPLLHSREQQRNKEPVLPGTGPVTSALSVLHQSALLGRVPHCLPPLARRLPHTQRCFCRDGCTTPLSSCFSYVTSGLTAGRRRLASHPEKQGKGAEGRDGSCG